MKLRIATIRAAVDLCGGFLVGAVGLLCLSATSAVATGVEPNTFGIARFTMQTTQTREVPDGPGSPGSGFVNEPYIFTQAGGHPFALTSMLELTSEEVGADHSILPTRDPKDMIIDLPPGLSANPLAVSRCPRVLAMSGESCPVDSQVGVFVLRFLESKAILGPIVDLTPETGQSAELGLETPFNVMVPLIGRIVRTARGYGFAIVANELPKLGVISIETTFWGVPAATVHDPQRGFSCLAGNVNQHWICQGGGIPSGEAQVPFLTMPADCSAGPQTGSASIDSWEQPGQYVQAQSTLPGMTGCNLLLFNPEIEVQPDTLLADEPVGVGVNIGVRQAESTQTVAASQLRDATVTLPQGVSISPGVADGLQACNRTGSKGIDIPTGLNTNGETLEPGGIGEGEEIGPSGEPELAPGHCPEASTIGVAEALTPLLQSPIKGRVYLATPGCGGVNQQSCTERDAVDGNLYRLYVELGGRSEGGEGVNIRVEGKVEANPATGQLTVKLMENPQLPLTELKIDLNGGPRALLDNPATCGPAKTTSDLEPWSAPGTTPPPESLFVPGTPDTDPTSFYDVEGCANSPTLDPGVLTGTLTPQAGAFSTFTFTVTRSDREQYLSGIQLHTPPGLSAMLSSVPVCEDALASRGQCPEASRIGSTVVASGAGSHPSEMSGRMYLTAGYEGAPFGLSIVTDAVAGPFNLGAIVIRARIDIDPETSALTITTDPLPQIVLGTPLRLQRVTLDIDRPGLIFNPTNCKAQRITARIEGVQGGSAGVSRPFAAGDCKALGFKPDLKASTSAHTSYASGASLDIRLTFPDMRQGTEANLARIKVALPRQLPSRLTTLQSSCPSATFNADPSACPKTSIAGIARARTPVLPVQLAGPVYFVSHGHDMFPSPIVVLQGDGVRLDLVGSTVIDKAGITDVAFNTIPDIPVDNLELYLPQGPHSVLSANANLCALRNTVTVKHEISREVHGRALQRTVKIWRRVPITLTMPTELAAQNGAVIHQNTKIEVTGCTRRKAKTTRPGR